MGLIKNIRRRFQRYFLDQELQKRRRRLKSVNWEDARYIGILFNAGELEERQTALNFRDRLKKEGKKVRMLGFFDGDQKNANFTFKHFNRKNIDWALRPDSPEIREFLAEAFDLLLNIEPVSQDHTEYLSALSQARLKVGPASDHTDSYDLMIEAADRKNVQAFIQQIEGLLKKTQTRHEAIQV